MRVLRGTSLKGLTGIPGVGAWGGVPIVRPLLAVSRADIEAYLHGHGQDYREDHTNSDPQYLRNRVRHQLLPLLRDSFNPQVDEALCRLSQVALDENAVLEELSEEAYQGCVHDATIDRAAFGASFRALQRRVLVRLAHEVGAIADFDKIEGALEFIVDGTSGQRYDWGGCVLLSNGRERTQIVRAPAELEKPVTVTMPGLVQAFGKSWTFTALDSLPEQALAAYCTPTRQVVDAQALGDTVVLRHRQDGDRFQPFGMNGTRKLKDYLNDSGLPLEQRDALVLVTAGDAIVWVAGYAVAQPYVATDRSQQLIQIDVTPL
jgi:tRNA(Ile)-lysidine synthase